MASEQPTQQPESAPVQQPETAPQESGEVQEKQEEVKLVSKDGVACFVPLKALGHCGMMREMFTSLGYNGDPIPLPDIDGETLELIAKWMIAHVDDKHEYTPYYRNAIPYDRRPEDTVLFCEDSCNDEVRTKIMNAANYLDAPRLTDAVLAEVAAIIKGLSIKNIVQRLNLEVPRTEEELQSLREQYAWFDL